MDQRFAGEALLDACVTTLSINVAVVGTSNGDLLREATAAGLIL